MRFEAALRAHEERLRQDGCPGRVRGTFDAMYRAYLQGETGRVEWATVSPPGTGDLIPLSRISGPDQTRAGIAQLGRVAWIVLNGGLGTSMHMDRAKSLLPVKGELNFLDLIVRHVLAFRDRSDRRIPLLFMHSYATRDDCLEALRPYERELEIAGLPLDFVQHRFPRIRERDGMPHADPADREAWAPPGHGDLYLALHSSGVLGELLDSGARWAFVSNADNLGASIDPAILGYMAGEGIEFVMEVTPKTHADVKGGTLIRRGERLELLEIAQVPEGHTEDFQDIGRFPAFNTNNLWIDLTALQALMDAGALKLPLIVNRKVADGTPVVQLETAMGAAIREFERTRGIIVPRSRFAPVKTTDDLLVRRSDAYVDGVSSPLVINPERDASLGPPVVKLDPAFYKAVPDMDVRIPDAPSLVGASRLEVRGDVRFGRGVRVNGAVRLENLEAEPLRVPDGAVLSG